MPDVLVDEVEPGHFVVRLNRPQTRNALAMSMVDERHGVLGELNTLPHVRAVVDRALATARQIAENSALGVWMTEEATWQTVDATAPVTTRPATAHASA